MIERPEDLTVEVVRVSADVELVRLGGELDVVCTEYVVNLLCAVVGSTVVVDLEHLGFIDASGVAALLGAKQQIEASGPRLELRGARGIVRRVFEITDLEYLLDPPAR